MILEIPRSEYVVRDAILNLLSDQEMALVSTREAAAALVDGDEYLDLDHTAAGVRRAHATFTLTMNRLLPRHVVRPETWSQICSWLTAAPEQ